MINVIRRLTPILAAAATASCASLQAPPKVELPKLPMGMGTVLIEPITNDPDEEAALRVSPDGKFLLFNVLSSTKPASGPGILESFFKKPMTRDEQIQAFYEQNSISLIEIGKAGRTIVGQDGSGDPGWLPDNKGFLFSMRQGKQAMLASSVIGQGTSAVKFVSPTPCVAYDRAPSVSPNGQSVLFMTSTPNEGSTLATMEIKATDAKCRLLFPGEAPQWSLTGRKFVFSRVVGGRSQVFSFDESRNLLTQLTFGGFDNTDPAWSADGTQIVFVSNRTGTWHVFTLREDGSGLVQRTQGPTSERYPTWGRDDVIYFVSNAGGQPDIWRAKLQSR